MGVAFSAKFYGCTVAALSGNKPAAKHSDGGWATVADLKRWVVNEYGFGGPIDLYSLKFKGAGPISPEQSFDNTFRALSVKKTIGDMPYPVVFFSLIHADGKRFPFIIYCSEESELARAAPAPCLNC